MDASPSSARFETEGILHHARSDVGGQPPCLCCKDLPGEGHIFMYGVDLAGTAPGARGPRPEHPEEWLNRMLYPLRANDGARVRITVEVEHDG